MSVPRGEEVTGMGRIQIDDQGGEWELTTARWDGVIELQLDDDVLQVGISDRSPYSADDVEITESGNRGPSSLFGDGPLWLLYAPTVLGVLALVVDKLSVFQGFGTSISWAIVVGLYWSFFLFAVFGTILLYNDAKGHQAAERDWQPNPWQYVLSGGVAVSAIQTAFVGLPSGTLSGTLAYVVGLLVVGCVVSSGITGPIYLFIRTRRLSGRASD
ncbi:hypothetical protein [Halorientalis salina]|uniref:hypothetical protein n=1 Tax=Halorientalis salina TaxID=2932266 RepID=UPI0010AC4244|nr:hypothetical protein [Halorientalis salina]